MSHSNRFSVLITATFAYLVVFDAVLVLWVLLAPKLWFSIWHGSDASIDDPHRFLLRCGANWSAFLLLQLIALIRFQKSPQWLAIVAGVRLSDIFTDATVSFTANHITLVGRILLPAGSLMNLLLGIWLLYAYKQIGSPVVKST